MDEEDLKYFRAKLLAMREQIITETGGTRHEMQTEDTLYPDPTDRASLETDRNTVLRIRDRERKLVGKIAEALERIENKTFGLCEVCGGPIGRKRLEVRPVTTLCIQCKEEQEDQERAK